jgi:hypothetical protein
MVPYGDMLAPAPGVAVGHPGERFHQGRRFERRFLWEFDVGERITLPNPPAGFDPGRDSSVASRPSSPGAGSDRIPRSSLPGPGILRGNCRPERLVGCS